MAYVASFLKGLQILDVSGPAQPKHVGGFAGFGPINAIEVQGAFAYIATSDGLIILDVSDPTNPFPTHPLFNPRAPTGPASNVTIADSLAYVVGRDRFGAKTLKIIDVNDPASPQEIGAFETVEATRVHIAGSYAYVAEGRQGLQIFDIKDPFAPKLVKTFDTLGETWDVHVSGNTVYLADGSWRLRILDVNISGASSLSLFIRRSPSGVELIWNGAGKLETAEEMLRPWLPLEGATSPMKISATTSARFYRLRP